MRQILSRSLLTVAAASSILAATGGYASADSGTESTTSGSPGLLSGDTVSAPIDVPVNACGNTADVAAVGNPAFGNSCGNHSHSAPGHSSTEASSIGHSVPDADADAGADMDQAGPGGDVFGVPGEGAGSWSEAGAQSTTTGSPGVLAGNSLDIPVHAPVNACGNTVDPIALLNPAMGNSCAAEQTPQAPAPDAPVVLPAPITAAPAVPATPPQALSMTRPQPVAQAYPQLAETGGGLGGRDLGVAGATSAALLLGGAMLYRRGARPAAAVQAASTAAHRR
jgi:hypothetical protein